MSEQGPDPIAEIYRDLDQAARTTIAGLMQAADVMARRGANKARAERDEQVAIAQAAGAQLESDYAGQGQALAADGPADLGVLREGLAVSSDDATLPASAADGGLQMVPVEDGLSGPVDLTNAPGSPAGDAGAVGGSLDQDNALPNASTGSAPTAGSVTLEALLISAHPMPVREEVGAAAAAGPSFGLGTAAQAAQQLATVQGVQLSGAAELG